jgi:cell division protein FtsW
MEGSKPKETSLNLTLTSQVFLTVIFLIMLCGIVSVYSASFLFAKENFGNSSFFFSRQIIFVILGFSIIKVVQQIPIAWWIKYSLHFCVFLIVSLVLTLLPPLGVELKGARRWINLGIIFFQPGEFLKYGLIIFVVRFFENFSSLDRQQLGKFVGIVLVSLLLLVMQPDFGALAICILGMLFVCFMSSFPRKYFYGLLASALVVVTFLIALAPYRMQRVLTYLDPWKDPLHSGFQIIQSYLAFASGHILGRGIGNSNAKLFYLPEAYNDFVLSVIGEEYGFIGVLCLAVLFLIFIYFGLRLALMARNRESMICSSAITFLIGIQAFMNMGVVLGLLPTKGLNLPFVSYGGSSMMANCWAVGLVLAVDRESVSWEWVNLFKEKMVNLLPVKLKKLFHR